MSDPKMVHHTDQAIAAYRNLGACTAAFYASMVNSGMTPEHAVRVVIADRMATTVGAQFGPLLRTLLDKWGGQ